MWTKEENIVTLEIDVPDFIDVTEAPDWATHLGRDFHGWFWFDHQPCRYDERSLVKGLLNCNPYPNGKCEHIDYTHNRPGELAFAALEVAKTIEEIQALWKDATSKRDQHIAELKVLNKSVTLYEAAAKAKGVKFIK
ncbi:hypothetical protein D3C84_104000 [compost metagenome]